MDRYVSPVDERTLAPLARAPRLATLEGAVIGFLDINKPKGEQFLNRLEELLKARGVAEVVRLRKPTFTRPAPAEVIQMADRCGAVVEALAD